MDEGRCTVDDLVETGRKMHQAQLTEIQAREETLDSIMRETEETQGGARLGTSAAA